MNGPGQDMVTLTIDGRKVRAPSGSYLLQVARDAGIEIPTLCDHPDLEPVGACRLCMVEVTHPDWNGWKGLMTSCLYPVAEGIVVDTRSPKVMQARRQELDLLVARVPGSAAIRKLADQHGCKESRFAVQSNADNCIVCGLCTRVCETFATAAITTFDRGATKNVGPFAGKPPTECIGCGACAQVCPTDNIPAERTDTDYRIWQRVFPTHVVVVDDARCMGCGSCEEACPFHVARVALRSDGVRGAVIAPESCRGCGACVGACPSGALDQKTFAWPALLVQAPASTKGGVS